MLNLTQKEMLAPCCHHYKEMLTPHEPTQSSKQSHKSHTLTSEDGWGMSHTGTMWTKASLQKKKISNFVTFSEIVEHSSLPLLQEYLCVLHRDLQDECQTAVVEGLIQSNERPVDAAFQQVAAVLPQPNGYDPVDHLLIGPHQHIWSKGDVLGVSAASIFITENAENTSASKYGQLNFK